MSDSSQHPAAGAGSLSLVQWLQALPNESPAKAVIMTLLVCVFASVIVAGSAVILRPKQIANRQLAQERQIVEILRGAATDDDVAGQVDVRELEARVVDLATGNYAVDIDAATFDERRMTRDPVHSVKVAPG